MNLTPYAAACTRFMSELTGSLTPRDVDALRADCAALGRSGWNEWASKNIEEIALFVLSTPAQRKKKKAWQEGQRRRRLVLGALHHVCRAKNLLEALSQHDLKTRVSDREMATNAGLLYLYIASMEIPNWPFPGKNPFVN